MSHYYSAVKDCYKRKRIHPFYKLTRAIVGAFFPDNEFLWNTEKPSPDEPLFMVCNHTKIYAPVYFLLSKKTVRTWANCYFLFYKDCWAHLKSKVLTGKRRWLKPLGFLLTPLIVWTFRATEPIPVYHKTKKVQTTFEKSIETMNENVPQVIFPERTENKVNRYVYEFNAGFPMVAELYYKETGKRMKFYPVYCAEKLRTFVAGDPIEYDPDVPMKLQRQQICRYLEDKIRELGDSLPEHEPVIYG